MVTGKQLKTLPSLPLQGSPKDPFLLLQPNAAHLRARETKRSLLLKLKSFPWLIVPVVLLLTILPPPPPARSSPSSPSCSSSRLLLSLLPFLLLLVFLLLLLLLAPPPSFPSSSFSFSAPPTPLPSMILLIYFGHISLLVGP